MRARAVKSAVLALICILSEGIFILPVFSQESKTDEGTKESVPRAGVNGVGFPSCTYCPAPNYSKTARADKLEGAVWLEVTVTLEGKAADIIVKKGLGDGLDEEAIKVVKSWKFKPAKDGAGKLVAVRVPVEIQFRLMK